LLPPPSVTGTPAVDDIVTEMPLRSRIAQRFVIAVPRGFGVDDAVSRGYLEMIMTDPPAGMILYPWNYTSRADVVRIIAKLQRAAISGGHPPFLIGVDQEGGRVAAFRFDDILRLPAAAAVARHNDPVFVESVAYAMGVELSGMGVNMNFAPVLDVTDRGDASIIGDRAWSGDPEVVADLGRAYLSGLARAGVIATAKHYPGHGVTAVDSHGRLPVVDLTLDELEASHLVPFRAAIDAGVPAIMTAHLLFPRIDGGYAVTISEFFLRDHLRYDLGFAGVLISDALSMRAMSDNYSLEVTLERALRYDVDLLLLNAGFDYTMILDEVETMMADGRVSEDDINRGVLRVMNLKQRYGLLALASREESR
jgi:beta-N-acetylhexosaminidase